MRYIITIFLIVSFHFIINTCDAEAAKAVAVVNATQSVPGAVMVSVTVSEDSGAVSFSTTFTINFASSVNQINADIKQRVRDELIRFGVAGITINDIILFGGAS